MGDLKYICSADISIITCEYYNDGACTQADSKCGFCKPNSGIAHTEQPAKKPQKWFEKYYK